MTLFVSKITEFELMFLKQHKPLVLPLFERIESKKGTYSFLDLPNFANQCGIYILQMSNSTFYVGQTKNISQRYKHHIQSKKFDIMMFKNVSLSDLSNEEVRIIKLLDEHRVILRNIELRQMEQDNSFTTLFSIESQKKWLATNSTIISQHNNRYDNQDVKLRYKQNFQRLKLKPYYDIVLEIASKYVCMSIPEIIAFENQYWFCSCPASTRNVVKFFLGYEEVFTITILDNELLFTIALLYEPLKEKFGKQLNKWTFSTVETIDKTYIINHKQNKIVLQVKQADISSFLEDDIVIKAIKGYNLLLLQNTIATRSEHHCTYLADEIIATIRQKVDKVFA